MIIVISLALNQFGGIKENTVVHSCRSSSGIRSETVGNNIRIVAGSNHGSKKCSVVILRGMNKVKLDSGFLLHLLHNIHILHGIVNLTRSTCKTAVNCKFHITVCNRKCILFHMPAAAVLGFCAGSAILGGFRTFVAAGICTPALLAPSIARTAGPAVSTAAASA